MCLVWFLDVIRDGDYRPVVVFELRLAAPGAAVGYGPAGDQVARPAQVIMVTMINCMIKAMMMVIIIIIKKKLMMWWWPC